MHFSAGLGISLLPVAFGLSHPDYSTWSAATDGDVRAPCPMLNSLANHEFLPHNGRNITVAMAVKALGDSLNIDPAFATTISTGALRTNPTPNATWFDLDMLNAHNIIEHDASMSRRDAAVDPSNRFDPATFQSFLDYFGNATVLTVNATGAARARHAYGMSKINPDMLVTTSNLPVMMGESALMLLSMGRVTDPNPKRELVEYFFRNERLPVELGWERDSTVMKAADVSSVVARMAAASPADVQTLFSPGTAEE